MSGLARHNQRGGGYAAGSRAKQATTDVNDGQQSTGRLDRDKPKKLRLYPPWASDDNKEVLPLAFARGRLN